MSIFHGVVYLLPILFQARESRLDYCPLALSGHGTNLALIGAYILAGELTIATNDYTHAFMRYRQLLHLFAIANQEFGASVSKSFLVAGEVPKVIVEQRMNETLKSIQIVSTAIELSEYE